MKTPQILRVLVIALLVLLVASIWPRAGQSQAQSVTTVPIEKMLREQNEQLKRIATSLEIIAGQRGQWSVRTK